MSMQIVDGAFDAAAWLTDSDELPHAVGTDPLWSENWLTYGWSPENAIGVYFHICRRPGPIGVYEETFNVYLPENRVLTSRGFAPIRNPLGPNAGAVSFECNEPFKRWTKSFRGAARLVTVQQLWAGPLEDGPQVDVDFTMSIDAMSPPFDYGAERLEQSWGTGHYEQHHEMTGVLRFDGQEFRLQGAGLRDHSWGPRDWTGIGETTWYHGQFTGSGRSFMVISVPGRPPFEPFRYAVVSDRHRVYQAAIEKVPDVPEVYRAGGHYRLELTTAAGPALIHAEPTQSMPMTFIAPAEIGHGIHQNPTDTHDFIETMTRFEWDGEVGYGMVTGCLPRIPAND